MPNPADVAALIVTGSPASVVDRAPWTVSGEKYLVRAVEAGRPVFGICYGHQMLAMALGGQVERSPNGREIGTLEFEVCADDPMLEFDGAEQRSANFTHVDSVVELPAGAERIARSRLDPNCAVRFAPNAWGVQFHPEFDADVMRHYVRGRRELLIAEGLDADAIEAAAGDGPAGAATLRRFVESLPTLE